MITITFNEEFRTFPKNYVAKFDNDKVVLVGDNATGKSTLMLIIVSKLFMDIGFKSVFLDNALGKYMYAIKKNEITVETDKETLPVIRDEEDFNNFSLVQNEQGGIPSIVRYLNASIQSSGEKKLEEVLDNIDIQKRGYADYKAKDGLLLLLDEPDANLSLASLLKLRKELETVDKYFIIYHNPYMISKEKEVYYLRLGENQMACKLRKISGETYIKEQEKLFEGGFNETK